jgi:hypothetical protein
MPLSPRIFPVFSVNCRMYSKYIYARYLKVAVLSDLGVCVGHTPSKLSMTDHRWKINQDE